MSVAAGMMPGDLGFNQLSKSVSELVKFTGKLGPSTTQICHQERQIVVNSERGRSVTLAFKKKIFKK